MHPSTLNRVLYCVTLVALVVLALDLYVWRA